MMVNVLFLIAGMFIDGSSATIILAPLLYPVAESLGIDLVHFGVMMVANIAIGMFSPPFGLNLLSRSRSRGSKDEGYHVGCVPVSGDQPDHIDRDYLRPADHALYPAARLWRLTLEHKRFPIPFHRRHWPYRPVPAALFLSAAADMAPQSRLRRASPLYTRKPLTPANEVRT